MSAAGLHCNKRGRSRYVTIGRGSSATMRDRSTVIMTTYNSWYFLQGTCCLQHQSCDARTCHRVQNKSNACHSQSCSNTVSYQRKCGHFYCMHVQSVTMLATYMCISYRDTGHGPIQMDNMQCAHCYSHNTMYSNMAAFDLPIHSYTLQTVVTEMLHNCYT